MRCISCCWPSCPNAGMQPFGCAPSGHCCRVDQQRDRQCLTGTSALWTQRYQLHSMLRQGCHQTLLQVSPAGLSRAQCRSGSPPPNQSGRRTWRSSWPPSRSDYPSNASFQGLQALSHLPAPSFWPHRRSLCSDPQQLPGGQYRRQRKSGGARPAATLRAMLRCCTACPARCRKRCGRGSCSTSTCPSIRPPTGARFGAPST